MLTFPYRLYPVAESRQGKYGIILLARTSYTKGRATMTTTSEQPTVVTPADWISGPRQGEWTYDAYAALPDDGQRYEIIDGVLLLTPSTHSPQHQRGVGHVARCLSNYVENAHTGEVFIGPLDVELASNTVVQPDILTILNTSSTKITSTHIQGVPDLVVEVSSPGTVGHDRSTKQKAYERAGVREYWFVDPLAHTIEILVLQGKTYTSLGVFSGELTLPSLVVPALEEVPAEKFFV